MDRLHVRPISLPIYLNRSLSRQRVTDLRTKQSNLAEGFDFEFQEPLSNQSSETLQNPEILKQNAKSAKSTFWQMSFATAVPLISSLTIFVTLLALVYFHVVHDQGDIFVGKITPTDRYHILVDYSATSLTFVSSILPNINQFLPGMLMSLWNFRIARGLRDLSRKETEQQPTLGQFTIIVGLGLAMSQALLQYFKELVGNFHHNKSKLPAILHRAAAMAILVTVLTVFLPISNSVLNAGIKSINIDLLTQYRTAEHEYGYGLSKMCLDHDPNTDYCDPCTAPSAAEMSPSEYALKSAEINRIQANTSTEFRIEMLSHPMADMAILVSQSGVSNAVDYRTSTIAFATQCQFITDDCAPKDVGSYLFGAVQFNCTDNFYGVLGLDLLVNSSNPLASIDPNVPELDFKPSSALQFGFFSDSTLNQVYNPAAWDRSPNSVGNVLPGACPADSYLVNPIYMAVAGRFSRLIETGDVLTNAPGFYNNATGKQVSVETIMNCSVSSYLIDYYYHNGAILNFTSTLIPNGSVTEMYQGALSYIDPFVDLQMNLLQAAAETSPEAFSQKWSNLHSVKALSSIAPFLSPRRNRVEQGRSRVLVACVSTLALAFALVCTILWALLSLALGCMAFSEVKDDEVRELWDELGFQRRVDAGLDVDSKDLSFTAYECSDSIDSGVGPSVSRVRAVAGKVVGFSDPAAYVVQGIAV